MTDGKRSRRRRGRRGGAGRAPQDGAAPDAQGQVPESPGPPRPARRDNRRSVRGDAPPGLHGVRRAPMPERGPSRSDRGRRSDGPASGDRSRRSGDGRRPSDDRRARQEDRGPRVFEPPVPQDPQSMELGAAFREAQTAMRDARKALDKRRAEFGDEPEWLVEQLAAAEARFAAAADEWAAHLATTGRKVVRNR